MVYLLACMISLPLLFSTFRSDCEGGSDIWSLDQMGRLSLAEDSEAPATSLEVVGEEPTARDFSLTCLKVGVNDLSYGEARSFSKSAL